MTSSTEPLPLAASSCETIADLVSRLGAPPESIVDVWCDQFRDAAIDHENRLGQPLPEIDLKSWAIGPEGELRFASLHYPCPATSSIETAIHTASEEHIKAFRSVVLGFVDAISPQAIATEQIVFPRKPKPVLTRRRFIVSVAVLALLGFAAFLSSHRDGELASKPNKNVSATQSLPAPQSLPATLPLPRPPSLPTPPSKYVESVGTESISLETFQSEQPSENQSLSETTQSLLAVDSLLPLESLVPESDEAEWTQTSDDPTMSLGEVGSEDNFDALKLVADTKLPETPQSVRPALVQAVVLPAMGNRLESQRLENLSPGNLSLQFPIETAFELVKGETTNTHTVRDSSSRREIASIELVDGIYVFRWADDVKPSAVSTFHHGRLRDADRHVTYFRQSIEADPWPVTFAASDYRPTWELGGTIPPKVTRISVDFELPEKIEVGWIEPVDPASPRRTKALAVLTHRECEFIQIAVLMNLRCTTKLTAEIRFAGRLDPSMPWQTFTEDGLAQLASQWIERSARLAEVSRYSETVYDQASSRLPQKWKRQKEQLQTQIQLTSEMSTRLATLQAMVAELQQAGKIRCELLVRWPDGDQPILSMPVPLTD